MVLNPGESLQSYTQCLQYVSGCKGMKEDEEEERGGNKEEYLVYKRNNKV